MKEIGGYIELDTYHLPMLHEGAIALNCGRNALAYLLKARHIRRLWIPGFICSSVSEVCARENVPFSLYGIGPDLLPSGGIPLGEGEWLYFVNYYSQFDNDQILEYVQKYRRMIVDNAQSYFQMPIPHVDTIYTCRKYFGVADGAFLYTDAVLQEELPVDESFDRMRFLLGRFERTASEFYQEYSANNRFFAGEPVKRMSKLTANLLHGIDYRAVEEQRIRNFQTLDGILKRSNRLALRASSYMYPFLAKNGAGIRKKLIERKIYIPLLWPSVISDENTGETEKMLAENILPLPIDQRYDAGDMRYIAEQVLCLMDLSGDTEKSDRGHTLWIASSGKSY
ncbi:MAG: hypothetical protein J5859_02715 [Clostridia bacterium]|nr:hypothetical protein [Clostridia bacterium]